MKSFIPKILPVLLLVTVLTTGLTGCGGTTAGQNSNSVSSSSAVESRSNQTLFIKAYLDLLCRQDMKSYASACGLAVSKVEANYPGLLDNVIDNFITYKFSEAEEEPFREELKNIFNKCRYEVKEAVQNEDGSYSVPVEVKKLVVFKRALKKANADYDEWVKKQPEDADEEALTDHFIESVIQYCEEELMTPEYKDPVTISVTFSVSSDDPHVYNYDPEELGSLQAALADFSAWEKDVEDADD